MATTVILSHNAKRDQDPGVTHVVCRSPSIENSLPAYVQL